MEEHTYLPAGILLVCGKEGSILVGVRFCEWPDCQDAYRANHVDVVTRILKLGSKYIHEFAYDILND